MIVPLTMEYLSTFTYNWLEFIVFIFLLSLLVILFTEVITEFLINLFRGGRKKNEFFD